MEISQNCELPRFQIEAPTLSPCGELLRWVCEARNLTYFDRQTRIQPTLGVDQVRLISSEGTADGIGPALKFIDRRCRHGERVFGERDDEQQRNFQRLEEYIKGLSLPILQLWLFHLRTMPELHKSLLVGKLSPDSLFGADEQHFDCAAAESNADLTFKAVEVELAASETPFLSGISPGPADVIFAALSFPLVLPSNGTTKLPNYNDLPTPLKELIERFRERPAGRLALTIYQQARPKPQPILPRFPYGPTLFERIVNPTIVRHAAQLLVKWAPQLQIGNRLIVADWRNVTEVLDHDNDFLIKPLNGSRINEVSGPFILGMDRSPELMDQREHIYSAMYEADRAPFRTALETEPSRLLNAALTSGGKIDVVNGFARLVAGRTAAAFFGIHGPTEQDMLRVIRSIFHETFLNQADDVEVKQRGIAAGAEFKKWIDEEIMQRRQSGQQKNDVLGRLLASTHGKSDESRWMLAGLQVGAIDTTATVVANIVAEVVNDRRLKAAMMQDMDDRRRLSGWCWEALRRRPHNIGMLRQAGKHAKLGDRSIPEGTSVFLLTVGAMHDPAAFDDPNQLRPDRPIDRYLHFGRGLHQCSGRDLNAIQVPSLIRELLKCDVSAHSSMRTRGPFPDELIVNVRQADGLQNMHRS